MSAIAGLIHFDASAVDRDTLHRMQTLLTPYGRDAQHSWHRQNVGLIRTLLRTTAEDRLDQQPLWRGHEKLALVFDGRIDNRDELSEKLEIAPEKAALMADSELVYHACLRWETETPKHLLGDFALACWQPERQHLWLARDPLGMRPLYWYQRDDLVAFATMPKALFAIPGLTKAISEEQLHDYVCLIPMSGPETLYKDVYRVEPGQVVSLENGEMNAHFYHRFDPERELQLESDEAYVDAFREQFEQAVNRRLRSNGPIGAELSSGLDSSSVTATAAKLLAEHNQSLAAYTAMPREGFDGPVPQGRHADESLGAKALVRRFDNIEHIIIRTGDETPLDQLQEAVELLDRAPLNACNMAWWIAIRKDAAQRGIKVLLTGSMGNFSISYDGYPYLAWLVRKGRWLTLYKVYKELKQHQPTLRWRKLVRPCLSPLLPNFLWRLRESVQGRAFGLKKYSAINPDWSKKMGSQQRAKQADFDTSFQPAWQGRLQRIQAIHKTENGDYNALANAYGLEMRDPTADVRLIEFCLAVPESQYLGGGQFKWLLRRLMKDVLPPEILDVKTRGLQSADWPEQIDRAIPQIREELEKLKAHGSASDYLDIKGLEKALDDWPSNNALNSQEAELRYRIRMLRGLSVGRFIRYADEQNE
ncbi:asparagine synthetase B family protein [Vreelandella nanhaiensis]|uniref:asparagine synthase (glutamine-hydrolyzing) n=1 Tax=Vreelandella nanhaiensis TaxID=1258546 RepID=A0A433KP18_9GAMM|nr:asparagine synthetase B [Halomonas nanhaiensis]RUR31326.1 asparagine synthetase B [Halomonas nanhaiensis]